MRRTVKSSTVAVVAGSLHPNEKPPSAELRRYHGFGVDVALLQFGFDVADLDSLFLTWSEPIAMRCVRFKHLNLLLYPRLTAVIAC